MGFKIATNIAAMSAMHNLEKNSRKLEQVTQELSSGQRLNDAGDDSASMAHGKRIESDIRGMRQAVRNTNDAISLIQISEGGMNEIQSMLIRMRELSVQAGSDLLAKDEREVLNIEYQSLLEEIDRISHLQEFNGLKLLDGSGGEMDFQVGNKSGKENRITYDASFLDSRTNNIGVSGSDISDTDDALDAIEDVQEAINKVSDQRAQLGAIQSRLNSTIKNSEETIIGLEKAKSNIMDTDIADASSRYVAAQIIKNAGVSVLAQANHEPWNALKLLG